MCDFIFNLTCIKIQETTIMIAVANRIKPQWYCLETPIIPGTHQQGILNQKEEARHEAEAQTFIITPLAKLSNTEVKQSLFL